MTVRISRLTYKKKDYVVLSYPMTRPSVFAQLTRAELAVAEGIVGGCTTRQIARRRGVSERTIGNQLAGIYRKLGISSRFELVAAVSGARGAAPEE